MPALSAATSSTSPTGSRRTRGAPVSTWLPVDTSSSLIRPANGAFSTVSIFIDSSTSTGAPAATSSPTAAGVATTRAGAGERSTPPSSRLTRWVTPSTSTSWIGPWAAVTRRWVLPPTVSRLLYASRRSISASTACSSAPLAITTRKRCGPVRNTVTLYALPRSLRSIAWPVRCWTCGRPPRAVSIRRVRSSASSVSYASIPAATSATPECRCATRPPSARTRSIQPVSALPSITSGAESRSSTKLLLVEPPSMTTVVSCMARRSRASASSRSRPNAMILAIIESKSAGIASPSPTPVSTRMPGPAGARAGRSGRGRARSRGRDPRR